MDKRNIIVMGASAGGFDALKAIVKGLPPSLDASIFIVWHMSPNIRGVLPDVLNSVNTIYAAHAHDNEAILPNRIYVAPPDHHLLIEDGHVRVTHGPKENRFRPAVDPLFRSAAFTYRNRVIGVILSGALDDGTSGLWAVKNYGGVAVVQDPADAEVSSMPESALRAVQVDYTAPVAKMAALLTSLSQQAAGLNIIPMKQDEQTKAEIKIAESDSAFEQNILQFGHPSTFACPECHGVLSVLKDGERVRYRCHTGHAYSADSLLAAVTEKIEDNLYSAIRGIEESVMLLNHMGDHFAEANHPRLAALYFKKANEAEERAALVRQAIIHHELLNKDNLLKEADEEDTDITPVKTANIPKE